jgi:hypothetical protein
LLMGIVTKGKLSAIFIELSASKETIDWRTEADFLFFWVVLGHATEQQWETAWEFVFAYARYAIVVKWNGKYMVMMIVECQIHATWYAWLMEYVPCDWVTHEHHFQ